jgi:uncharacterized membrane protein
MPQRREDGLLDHLLELGVRDGIRFGLFMAASLSLYAGGILALLAVVQLVADPAAFVAQLPRALLTLAWIVLGYFGAFALAGALLGIVNAVRAGPLRYPLLGFVLGTAIYGGVGVAMKLGGLFDPKDDPPSWGFIGGMSIFMGAIWCIGGAVIGINRWRKARRSRDEAA